MITDTVMRKIEELADSGIYGCITGSCMIVEDCPVPVGSWGSEPDVDVFVYTRSAWIQAVQLLLGCGYRFGKYDEDERIARRNEVKWNRALHSDESDQWLETIEMADDLDITVNLTYKRDKTNVMEVVGAFDTTAVMKGVDIPSGSKVDMRTVYSESIHVARPNPLRWSTIEEDASTWKTMMLMKQWNRVIKLWDRGIDSRPLARAYRDLVQRLVDIGCLFDGEDSASRFELFDAVCGKVLRDNIIPWLEEVDDA